MFRNLNKILALFLTTIFVVISFIYAFNRFEIKSEKIESINVYVDSDKLKNVPTVYLYQENDIGFNFSEPHKPIEDSDGSLYFEFKNPLKIRKFRLYFEEKLQKIEINKIVLNKNSSSSDINCSELKIDGGIEVLNKEGQSIVVTDASVHGYIESPKHYLYSDDKISLVYIAIGLVSFLIIFQLFLAPFIANLYHEISGIKEFSIVMFIISIFLPHPIFNVTLILSALILIRDFDFRAFLANKINLIFVGLFFLLLLNDLFISASGFQNLKATERNLPLLILPVFISCIKDVKFIKYLVVSSILIGYGLFLTSFIDAILFKNISYFSFEEFAKYIHPVYFSYLLSFSLFYVYLYSDLKPKQKYITQAILFLFLILSGSKLVLSFTLVTYSILFVRTKKSIIIGIVGVLFLVLFPPIQNRFLKIINLNDLTIVNDDVIEDVNDPRVNGLTLRLLIWQESIQTTNTWPEYLFGIGVDDVANKALKESLVNRGLVKYERYSTHNQFINFYMRSGVVGLGIFLILIGYVLYSALRKKNKMLLIMIVMFIFAMLTESVFQRVLGIYFFTTVLLFLMKPHTLNENSDNWN